MNKGIIALLLGMVFAVPLAQPLDFSFSAGAGSFINFTYENDQWTLAGSTKYEDMITRYGTWGGWAFLDATFIEFSAGLGGSHGIEGHDVINYEGGGTVLHLAAYGKYPFALKKPGVYYPLLGVDSQWLLAAMTGTGAPFTEAALEDAQEQYNALWFKAGFGLDLDVTEKLYLRAQFLYGFKFYTDTEQDFWETNKEDIQTYAFHGPTLRLAFGYKLYSVPLR